MAHIRHIDREEYAVHALELFDNEREDFVSFACDCLKDGDSLEHTRESLVRRVDSYMKRSLFDYLKRTGKIQGDIRYDYTLGYCRRKPVEPSMSDVPSELLSISEVLEASGVLPKFADIIDSVLMDARKLVMVEAIEATTSEAGACAPDGNDNG